MKRFRSLPLLLALTLLLPLARCGALRSLKPVKSGVIYHNTRP